MLKLDSDVIVIGAGPAGSTVARTIANHGFEVILVEKDNYPGETNICAGGVTKSIIKEIGLRSDVISKEIVGEKHHYPWGLKTSPLVHATVDRRVFDRSIADKAVEEGVKLMTDTLIKDISIKNNRVHAISESCSIESKLVVFADGPNTMAYRKFGIGFKPDSDKTIVSVACEVAWEDNPLDHYEFYYGHDISPWGYGWAFPKRDTVNIGVGCLYSKLDYDIIDSLNYLLKTYSLTQGIFKEKKIVRLGSALIPIAPAERIFGSNALVAGDAAGMVDPITGGGIIPAINGGKLAGKVSIMALEEKDYSSSFLSQYQRLWHNSLYYNFIYKKYLLSNLFFHVSKIDKNAFPKLAVITSGKAKQTLINAIRSVRKY